MNMQLLSSTHSRRVYIISYLIVLKQSNLRGKIQDVSVLSISNLTSENSLTRSEKANNY